MDWETEKQMYAQKLKQIIEGIKRIKDLRGNRIMTPDMAIELDKLSSEAGRLLPKLSNEIFEIAIVGLEKAGKSSFSNALTGAAVLPTASERCTYTSTCLKAAEKDAETNMAKVQFHNKTEFEKDFSEKLAILKIPNAEKYRYRSLSLEKYEQLYDQTSEETKKLYGDSINEDVRDIIENRDELDKYIGHLPIAFNGDELFSEEFASFIKEPGRAIAVKNVTIFSTELKDMPNAVIYDVPGFDSPTNLHRQQTLERMKDADAIIMVALADKPSLNAPALSIFRENSDEYGCQLDQKMFVFANRADMAATKEELEKNIQTTYHEWLQRRKLLSERFKGRIFFGSANGHLGGQVPGGLEAKAKLESFGRKSGIDDFRAELYTYYKTERFEVLKQRVNTILNNVLKVFGESEKQFDGDLRIDRTSAYKLAIDTCQKLQGDLINRLRDIKQKINDEAGNTKPLKKEISSKIVQTISLENYHITPQEIEEKDKISDTVSRTQRPVWLNGEIRRQRFSQKHPEFTQSVLDCAVARHHEVADEILDQFMDSMNVSDERPEYNDLRTKIAVLCSLDKAEDNNYYRSLIDRFSRDLFEAHILLAHGQDRLKKFQKEAPTFLSLGVFYNSNEDDSSPVSNLLESRLWQLVLYPELAANTEDEASNFEKCLDIIRKNCRVEDLGDAIPTMVKNIVKYRGNMAAAAIETVLDHFRTGEPHVTVLKNVKTLLSPLVQEDNADFATIIEGSRYLDDRNKREKNYSYEQVIQDFDNDVLALREGLLKAFVPATDLDKAFGAKESALIESIIAMLQTKVFSDFVCDNMHLIKREETEHIDNEIAQRELDKAVMAEIRSILDSLFVVPR